MAPRARFELATLRLTAECSTVELPGNGQVGPLIYNSLQTDATLLILNLSPTSGQQRLHFGHLRGGVLTQRFGVVVNHLVRRMPAPISDDLTAHPGIHKVRNPTSSKGVHSDTRLHQ